MKRKETIELHRHFSSRWLGWGKTTWETLKLNIILSSALTSLTAYSIIYIYTSEFFWETPLLTQNIRLIIRIGLISVPITLILTNYIFHRNFHRQCKRMYQLTSIIIKIQEQMNLYAERPTNSKYFPKDQWYVPDEWKDISYQKSDEFVDDCMSKKERFYKNMLPLFYMFVVISIFLIAIELVLLVLRT